MKPIKKFSAILLIAAIAAALFTGCAKTPQQLIIGTWRSDIDMTKFVMASAGEAGDIDTDAKFIFPVEYTFTDDGKVSIAIVEDETKTNLKSFYSDFVDDMIEETYVQMEQEGTSREEADEMIEETFGMSFKEYIMSLLPIDEIMDSLVEIMESNDGTYEFAEDGRIVVTSTNPDTDEKAVENWTITIQEDTFTIDKVETDNEMEEDINDTLPWTFNRKK